MASQADLDRLNDKLSKERAKSRELQEELEEVVEDAGAWWRTGFTAAETVGGAGAGALRASGVPGWGVQLVGTAGAIADAFVDSPLLRIGTSIVKGMLPGNAAVSSYLRLSAGAKQNRSEPRIVEGSEDESKRESGVRAKSETAA